MPITTPQAAAQAVMASEDLPEPVQLVQRLTGSPEAVQHLAAALADYLRSPVLYTCQTLAAEVQCSPEAIGRAIRAGELQATRRAGKYVIEAEDAAQWARTGHRPRVRARCSPRPRIRRGADTPGSLALLPRHSTG